MWPVLPAPAAARRKKQPESSLREAQSGTGAKPCHLLVFRDSLQTFSGPRLLQELARELHRLELAPEHHLQQLVTSALLRAGELETSLSDAGNAEAGRLAQVTDLLAHALLDPANSRISCSQALRLTREALVPETIQVRPPEGFCYYGLHPLDYIDVTAQLPRFQQPMAVIGIRSIGTTLSAAFAAGLEKRYMPGMAVPRLTVRPQGHPYDRHLEFNHAESAWVFRRQKKNSIFFIVDEGPGLSGSSFLAVAEALTCRGIAPQDVIFIPSRRIEPHSLVAPDAATRWLRFRCYPATPGQHRPDEARQEFGGGAWRRRIFASPGYAHSPYAHPEHWPALWTELSSPRFLSADSNTLFKFEGLGRYGAAVLARSALVGESEFGPAARDARFGYTAYPMLQGRLLHHSSADEQLLRRMAAYLGFRLQMFAAAGCDQNALRQMARHNARELLQVDCGRLELRVEAPVVPDARMMPHEWIHTAAGRIMKLDAAAHGGNHFFPGATDIAWDLAGAILEWQLSPQAAVYLLDCYTQFTGDHAESRLHDYLVAYSAFQAGYHRMAASAAADAEERSRLLRKAELHETQLRNCLSRKAAQVA